ncbi:exo-beta-N-acetylmuramidase NamZ family protein [Halomontanus rarus]|uniref:exo-beta-N-acetylmuramidase NamZ family protein n=1 Tax=Halomontanus rarus TaxID=3034020 RepID=UPI0023E884A1|nr:DUF1343 domain-containing protein [Halovivax sp. TS33]
MVTLGIDRLLADPPESVRDSRLGLITNPSGVNEDLDATIDLLAERDDLDLRVVFGPEHGVRGDKQAGVEYEDGVDDATRLPMRSLYGDTRRLDPSIADDLDTVIFDIQSVGCRFYTYLYTLAYALEGLAGTDTEVLVLDRPNPIAPVDPDGDRIDEEYASFVGGYRLPIVHGLTVGELATYFDREFELGADLTVVEMEGWDHDTWYDETELYWVQPSPNIPTLTAATLYPGTCLFEGTNLSEGRGTTTPFETVGAPWIDPIEFSSLLNDLELPGVEFRPMYFTPTFSKHEGDHSAGVQIHVDDREAIEPVQVGLTTLIAAFQAYPETDWSVAGDTYTVDRLAGGPALRETVDEMDAEDDPLSVCETVRETWADDLETYGELLEEYRRY